jgi:type I restriction enzyme S subunit
MIMVSGMSGGASVRKWKPYPAYKDSGVEWIGEIPEGWKVRRFRFAVRYNLETLSESTAHPNYEIEYLDIGNVDEDGNILSTETLLFRDAPSRARRVVKNHNTIISTVRTYLKAIAYLQNIPKNMIVSTGFAVISCNSESDSKYFFYQFRSNYFIEQVVKNSKGVGYPAITPSQSPSNLVDIPLVLPSLPEQYTIADFLDRETARINGIIGKQTRMLELLKEKRSALITAAVTKGLDPKAKMKPSGIKWMGDIPEGWEVKKIKWASSIKNSNVNKKTEKGEKTILLCNYVDVYKNDFIDDSINFMEASATDDEIKKFILRENDVIITKDSEEWSDIAIPSFITKDFNNVICGYHLALLRPKSRDLYGKYLFRGLQSKPINTQFMVSANGITRFGLGLNSISSAYIILPPLSEQHAIADFLDRETLKIG